jgi:hypothetical protein
MLQPVRAVAQGRAWGSAAGGGSKAFDGEIIMIDSSCVRVAAGSPRKSMRLLMPKVGQSISS